jgi:hypothetical protein
MQHMVSTGFRKFVDGKLLVNPDVGEVNSVSQIECAMVCILVKDCTTFNLMSLTDRYRCQINRGKGRCMESSAVVDQPGCRMFQREVCILGICLHCLLGALPMNDPLQNPVTIDWIPSEIYRLILCVTSGLVAIWCTAHSSGPQQHNRLLSTNQRIFMP